MAGLLGALAVAISCGEAPVQDNDCADGGEGCRCYRNGTCDFGFECRMQRCERAGNPGSCRPGETACDGACVALPSDPNHCGACDRACDTSEVCSQATCSTSCAEQLTLCGRSCVNTASAADHCGACDRACAPGEVCVGSECGCAPGSEPCGTDCVPQGTCGAGGEGGQGSSGAGPGGAGGEGGEGAASGTGAMGGSAQGGTGQGGSGPAGGSSGAGSGMGGGGSGGSPTGGTGGGGPSGPPVVMLLLDNSSSMYEPREELWDAVYAALMDPTTGAIAEYDDRLRFGFASFRGPNAQSVPETDPSCAQIETVGDVNPATVAPALDSHAAIDLVYDALGDQGRGPGMPQAWETPTGHALKRVATTLAAFTTNPAGRKYIVLVTDGNPNTCLVGDPQCGQDLAVAAAQGARAAGITTLTLGFGDLITANTGCTPSAMRCGTQHLQDMANAGTGRPVEPPPTSYWFQPCPAAHSGMSVGSPVATYASTGGGDTARYYSGTTQSALRSELDAMFEAILAGSVP